MIDKVISFVRNQAVLCIAFSCAVASSFFVAPSAAYLAYIDMRVIVLLFCLMACVAGLRESGLFSWCAARLIRRNRSLRSLAFAMVMLPFFASMLITNDVALIAFVPFAAMALTLAGQTRILAPVIVLQAIAANLGGMVTPMGNPQNLFIYTAYGLSLPEFLTALAPFALLALALLSAACLRFDRNPVAASIPLDESRIRPRRFAAYGALFALCLLAVMRAFDYRLLAVVVIAALAIGDRRMLARVDYGLLATFVCFFIFSGNVAHIPVARDVLEAMMGAHPLLTSVAASQVISNVPAAVVLSPFTDNWHSLLLGVDLGGLGTPIASLASLIAFRLYMHTPGASAAKFMGEFALANAVGLAAMLLLYATLFVA